MNRAYSIVWNASLNCWSVASELTSRKICKAATPRLVLITSLSLFSGSALAGTCLQLDDLGTDSATGSGAPGTMTCGPFSIGISGGSGGNSQNVSIAIGDAAVATGVSSVGVGRAVNVTGYYATAVGSYSVASTNDATALGNKTKATGAGATAVGSNATAGAAAAAPDAIAIGGQSSVISAATSGIAVGRGSSVSNAYGMALGDAATSTVSNGIAIGTGAAASVANSVALGNASTTQAAVATTGNTLNGTAYTFAGSAPGGVVSMGSAATKRQVTNVAAGQVSSASTDAVNGSQLFATNQAVNSLGTQAAAQEVATNNLGNSTAASLGGGTTYNATTDTLSGFSQPVNTVSTTGAVSAGTTAQTTVAGALNALNTNINNSANIAVKYDTPGGNLITLGATGGTGATGSVRMTNLTAGALNATSTDAVNGSQLFATNTSVTNLNNALDQINNGSGVKYVHTLSTLTDSVASGTDSTAIGPAASATAANAIAMGNGATASVARSVALGDGATTQAATAVTGNTLNGTAYTFAGDAPVGVVSVGSTGNERQLTNVAAGQLTDSSTDAVNGSQLFVTNSAVDNLGAVTSNLGNTTAGTLGGGAVYDAPTGTLSGFSQPLNAVSSTGAVSTGTPQTTVAGALTALDDSVTNTANIAVKYDSAGGDTITLGATGGTGATGSVRMTNLTAGALNATSTDAVNGSQLFATNTDVTNLSNALNQLSTGTGIKYFHASSTLADSTATGANSVAAGPAASATADGAVAMGYSATASALNSVALGSGAAATGATLADAAYGVGGTATAGGEVNIASGAEGRRITGLAAGANATDAVNVSQLNLLGQNAVTALGGGAQLDPVTGVWTAPAYAMNSIDASGADTGSSTLNNVGDALDALNTSVLNTAAVSVQYDDAAVRDLVTFNPGGAATRLTNVAAGTLSGTSTDAVNGSQLFATNQLIDNISNGGGIKYFHSNSTAADSQALGLNSIAVGPEAVAGGIDSFAAGSLASAATDGSVAIGNQSQVLVTGGVALGQGAVASRAIAPVSGSIPVGSGAINYDTSDATLLGAVSVGRDGEYRQITNVADATEAHDAVTLRQLTGAMGSLSSTGTLYFHANSTATDSLAAGQESVAIGPATVVNGDSGIGMGNQAVVGQAATGGIAIGRNAEVMLASGIALGSEALAQGEQSVALGAGADASHALSVALGSGSVTTVGAESAYSAYRLATPQSSVGEVGIGTALGNRKITGVAAGTQASDAVNVAQLTAVGDQVDLNTTGITNLDGRVTVIENTFSDVFSGGGVKYFHTNSTRADSVASGTDSIAVGANALASGSGAVASGSDASATGTGSVAVGQSAAATADNSVALGSGASDNGRGTETYTGKYSGASNTTVGTVSVGNAATGETRTVSNVADGLQATDAVNVRQLDGAVAEARQYTDTSINNLTTSIGDVNNAVGDINNRIDTVEGDVSNIQNGTDGMFQVNNSASKAKPRPVGTNSVAAGAGSVASGTNAVAVGNDSTARAKNSVALGTGSVADRENSVSVGSTGNERQIANVAAGTQDTDAVNLGQLNQSLAGVSGDAYYYTDKKFSQLKEDLHKQDEILSAGIAGAMAMASLPQPSDPGANMLGIGGGSYRGESAVSFGVSRRSENGRWITKMQVNTNSQHNTGLGVGVGFQW